jgi:crotonobetainyl-CoA:carnitine CoA-transferase CaiB-like acyl-CoA transferase
MAGPLDGLVVLDLTTHLSGPFCGMQLADLGADVIKIESPQGDSMRGAPPFIEGESAPFMLWNRNKRGIRLDLKDAADLEAFWGLLDGADVVLENFRPGVMKRLGLGWEALSARNPRLVLGSISGFGQTGPYAGRGGFDLMVQAMSGLMSVTGPKGGPPYRIPLAISDVGAGLYLTIGILAALQARQATGKGQWVETSLLEATVSLGVYEAASYFANGKRPEKLGQAHRGSSPYQVFQTSDGWLTIGGAQQNFFRKLCAMIGKPEFADDPRFKTNAERVKNNDLIVGLLQAEVLKRSTDEWMVALEAEGIPAGPVLHHDEVFADPQILARGMVAEVMHAKAGRQKTLGVPIKMSATQGGVRRAAPALGQHDDEIKHKKTKGEKRLSPDQ